MNMVRSHRDYGLVGESLAIQGLWSQILRLAPHEVSIFIEGEEGAGKRHVAEIIHSLSPYREGPFMVIDCAATPELSLAFELFGCEPGFCSRLEEGVRGMLESANRGTLLLEHVEAMPKSVQSRLLRVIEGRAVERLVGGMPVKVDVRIIATRTRRADQDETEEQAFNPLWDRLGDGFPLRVPSLRERPEDIPLLSDYFLKQANREFGKKVLGFTPEARAILETYQWSGNLRELNTCLRVAVLIADRLVNPEHLLSYLRVAHARSEQERRSWRRP